MISHATIQEITDTARIEEVVSDFVTLKRRGSNLLGLCPFHNEKTPSFVVSPVKGIYKCFGCSKAGNSVAFIMEHEKMSYIEALRYLASKYNITIEEEALTESEKQAKSNREVLYIVNNYAQKLFSSHLFESDEGKAIGLTYFKERGFNEATIKKFQLGFTSEKWDFFIQSALQDGYKEQILIDSGLATKLSDKLFDKFRNRVIFPIHNITGKTIGFGGRIVNNEKNQPKYLNSPETEVYVKSKSLYGIFYAKNEIVSKDNCFLVEGYTDVISLHQAGISNVVASLGTSLTTEQIKIIKRYTNNITIIYDSDNAGIKASFRGIDMVLEQGMNVKIVILPEGDDPDSYARNHSLSEIEDTLTSNSHDFITFKTKHLLSETKNDPIKRASVINEIINSISLIPSAINRTIYIKECATLMNISEQPLVSQLNKLLRKNVLKNQNAQVNETIGTEKFDEFINAEREIFLRNDCNSQERDVIRILLNYGNESLIIIDKDENNNKIEFEVKVAEFICNDLKLNRISFSNDTYNKIFEYYAAAVEADKPIEFSYFANHIDTKIAKTAASLVSTPYELSEAWSEKKIYVPRESQKLKITVAQSVLALIDKKIALLIDENQLKLKNTSLNSGELAAIISRNIFLQQARREVNMKLGRVLAN